MLYLAIDQHRKQLTVNLRNEAGDVLLKRQVSTEWPRVREFLAEVQKQALPEEGFVVILEVCGFNDWLLKLLVEYGCRETILIQPEKQSKKKTDRRDANTLGEILWVNRQRLLAGKTVQGIRHVQPASEQDAADRQITALRKRLGQLRTRTINKVKHILRKHNLEQGCPTKGIDTIKAKKWLGELALAAIDRLEMDQLLAQWKLWDEQIKKIEAEIVNRHAESKTAALLVTIPGAGAYGSLALASRIGPIERFPRPGSLAELLGPDAGMPQLRRGHRPLGLDYQTGQRDGAVHPGAIGAACLAARCLDEGVVRPDQAAPRLEDCPSGSDAPFGDDHLAHGEAQRTLRDRRPTPEETDGTSGVRQDLGSGSTEGDRPFAPSPSLGPKWLRQRVRAEATAKAEGARGNPQENEIQEQRLHRPFFVQKKKGPRGRKASLRVPIDSAFPAERRFD